MTKRKEKNTDIHIKGKILFCKSKKYKVKGKQHLLGIEIFNFFFLKKNRNRREIRKKQKTKENHINRSAIIGRRTK